MAPISRVISLLNNSIDNVGKALRVFDPLTYEVGTAGWSIARHQAELFPGSGSHLERYAELLSATEINSSFHRSHKPQTYARWAASVPPDFRFAVKLPREITHTRKLIDTDEPLDRFLGEIRPLGGKLGPLLIQLPPSLAFNQEVATGFFKLLRARHGGELVCEPRHPSWFNAAAEAAFVSARIARVAADPAPVPQAARPGGWLGLTYRRLHGSPRMYSSPYTPSDISRHASEMQADRNQKHVAWCIFDNTMHGEAAKNALQLARALQQPG